MSIIAYKRLRHEATATTRRKRRHVAKTFVNETHPRGPNWAASPRLGRVSKVVSKTTSHSLPSVPTMRRGRGQATQNPNGVHIAPVANSNSRKAAGRPTGTTAQQAIRRLRKDRPDLHAGVIAGRKSPHGAMVEAGFRRKTDAIRSGTSSARTSIGAISPKASGRWRPLS